MKPTFIATRTFVLVALFSFCSTLYSQKDTLHIYYRGLATEIADSNDVKITNWMKSLKGKHWDVEIYSYYDNSDFKKYMAERAENLNMVVIRKARDLTTIKFMGPVKGKKSQRSVADVVYTPSIDAAAVAAAAQASKANKEEVKKKEEADKTAATAQKAEKKEKEKGEKEKNKKQDAEKKTANKEKGGEKDAKIEKMASDNSSDKEPVADTKSKKGKEDKNKKEEEEEEDGGNSRIPRVRDAGNPFSLSDDEVAMIKNARIIPCMIGNASEDSVLMRALAAHWTFNKVDAPMPYGDAVELAKKDKNILLMFNVKIRTKTVTHSSGRYHVALSKALVLQRGKYKIVLANFFPTGGDFESSQPMANFAMSAMNCQLNNMDQQKISKVKRINTPYEKDAEKLRDRRLLIPIEWLNKGLDPADVGKIYHGSFELVDYETYQDAIMKKRDCAYVVPTPVSMGGQLMIYDYLMDAKTGTVYYILQPAMFSNMAKIAGPSLPGTSATVHDLAHNERISRKNLEKYNRAFEKKGDKDDDEQKEGEGDEAKEKKESKDKKSNEAKESKEQKEPKEKKAKKEKKEKAE
jgi:hypothetical protein